MTRIRGQNLGENERQLIRTKVIHERRHDCTKTMIQIGKDCGISRERVRQILNEEHLKTSSHHRQKYVCNNCGKETIHKLFCNRKCRYEYSHPLFICNECGMRFRRSASWLISQIKYNRKNIENGMYCSKTCWGKHFSREHGFEVHPENCGRNKIYDNNLILDLWRKSGLTKYRYAIIHNIPQATMYKMLRDKEEKHADNT